MIKGIVWLIKSWVYKVFDGMIDFIATAADDFVELAYRIQLR